MAKYDHTVANYYSIAVKLEPYCEKCGVEVKDHCGTVESIIYKFNLYFDWILKSEVKKGIHKPDYGCVGAITEQELSKLLPKERNLHEKFKDLIIIDSFLENYCSE